MEALRENNNLLRWGSRIRKTQKIDILVDSTFCTEH